MGSTPVRGRRFCRLCVGVCSCVRAHGAHSGAHNRYGVCRKHIVTGWLYQCGFPCEYVCVLRRRVWCHVCTLLKMQSFSPFRSNQRETLEHSSSEECAIEAEWGPCEETLPVFFFLGCFHTVVFLSPLPHPLLTVFMEVELYLTVRQKWQAAWGLLSGESVTSLYNLVALSKCEDKMQKAAMNNNEFLLRISAVIQLRWAFIL